MSVNFGESFDLYATIADAFNGYWDSGSSNATLVGGRFAGSRALYMGTGNSLVKSSGANDPVHHFVVSFINPATLSGASAGVYLELFDGTTAQCSIVFRSDGAILLTSGGPTGTTLATYTGAVTAASTWYAFEFEVVINATAGSFTVRKNGATSASFSATALNTAPSGNAYANKMTLGMSTGLNQQVDDLFWQSGAATGAWLGDLRCYVRLPVSDQSVQFSQSGNPVAASFYPLTSSMNYGNTQAIFMPFLAPVTGALNSLTVQGFNANSTPFKAAIYDSSGAAGNPGAVLATSNQLANQNLGANVFTFSSPPTLTKGTLYWYALNANGSIGSNAGAGLAAPSPTVLSGGGVAYASWPNANPSSLTFSSLGVPASLSFTVTPALNAMFVGDYQEDGLASYVYDTVAGHADFYGLMPLSVTPASVVATTLRGYMQKSDAGGRSASIQLKSGGTTVATPTMSLSSSGFQWSWRTDVTDPNTGAAWNQAAVSAAQIGPLIVA